jgi:mannitol-1-phosphate 5-dehydrogenase
MLHMANLLDRFTNVALRDTCSRVGREPTRKLSPNDRLIGSATLASEMDITPAYIAIGAAAGLCRYMSEEEERTIMPEEVITSVCELDMCSELAQLILDTYEMIKQGMSFGEIRRAADRSKAKKLTNVI